eukprot:352309-Chlamydomonas_euryale.AAC.6
MAYIARITPIASAAGAFSGACQRSGARGVVLRGAQLRRRRRPDRRRRRLLAEQHRLNMLGRGSRNTADPRLLQRACRRIVGGGGRREGRGGPLHAHRAVVLYRRRRCGMPA